MNKNKTSLILFSLIFISLINLVSAVDYGNCMLVSEPTNQDGGANVECPSGYVVTSGGFSGILGAANIEKSYPIDNGWYCNKDKEDGALCWAVCCDASKIDTEIIEKQGKLNEGLYAECPDGYEIVGGGFYDDKNQIGSSLGSDQDVIKPLNNGWYCYDDDSGKRNSKCYAVCAKSKLAEQELSCTTVSETKIIDGKWVEAFAECPEDYFLTGGGFSDLSRNEDDQDFSYPINNGWFCREDIGDKPAIVGVCYAQCCSFVLSCSPEEEICDDMDNDCDGLIDEDNVCEIECSEDENCGIDSWLGQEFCESTSDVFDSWIDYECINPGTYESYCSNSIELKLKEDCGLPSSELVCIEGDVNNKTTTPICTNGECENLINYELVEECGHECNNGVCIECCENEDCGTNGFIGNKYCIDRGVYQDYQEFGCINSFCSSIITPILIEECSYMCVDGECVEEECYTDEDCPEDYYGENYCQNNEVYREFYNYFCGNNKCNVNITEESVENCGEDYCQEWQNFCKSKEVWKKRTCYDKGCVNGSCYSNSSIEEQFVEECGYECENGKCIEEDEDRDSGGRSRGKRERNYCGDGFCDEQIGENEFNCQEDCKIFEFRANSEEEKITTESTTESSISLGEFSKSVEAASYWIPLVIILGVVLLVILVIIVAALKK